MVISVRVGDGLPESSLRYNNQHGLQTHDATLHECYGVHYLEYRYGMVRGAELGMSIVNQRLVVAVQGVLKH